MINIYDKTETVFNHSGLATLEPIECVFAPMINDVWKLELTLPYDSDEKYKTVQNDRLIRVTDLDAVSEQSSTQIFRIYDYKKESSSVYVLAYPVALDARFEAIADHLDLRNKSASDAIAVINNMAAKYTVTTDLTTTNTAEYDNVNMIEALNGEDGFVQKWGGDICYDNYNIKVREALGNQNSNFDIRYGKNIQAMSIEEDTSNVITRIYPKSSRGDIFNAIEQYAIGETRYIDSQYIDMNLIHNYFVEVPHTLVTLSDDGSEEYLRSQHYYENIFTNAQTAINVLTNTILRGGGSYSPNINLEWIAWFATLTFEQNGTEGFAERVARLACVNCVDDDYKELVSKAVHDAFSDYFSTIISDTSYDWVEQVTPYGRGYAYCPNENPDWRWKNTWIKDSNKWKYVDSDGYYYEDAEHEATGFDWYKKKGLKYKRYGKKSNEPKKGEVEHFKYYLHDEHYKLNDVWYYFNSQGKGIKGKNLLTTAGLMGLYDGVVEYIQSNVEEGEAGLFELLYTQMYNHCINMFTEDGVDIPAVNMEIDVVDLSKTTEYKDYEGLLKIHLGDKVKCVNYKLDRISTERVIGLEYDVIRGYNRKVYIGETTNSVINMLNISNSGQTKLIPGEGIEINNNVISIKPQPVGITDVIVNGESVVIGDIASFDLDEPIIEGTGLEYFVETEDTLTGDETYTETEIRYDDSFESDTISAYYYLGVNSYTVIVSANPTDTVLCATIENVLINSYASYGATTSPGFLMMSKNPADLNFTWHYIDPNGGVDETNVGHYSSSVDTGNLLCYQLWNESGRATVNGETWYGVVVYLLSGGIGTNTLSSGFAPSVNKYIGSPGNKPTYQTLSSFMADFISRLRTETTVTKTIYNGIARKNKLAFFAGGEDDEGLNAPIKIWADGTYQGITKAVKLTQAEYDALTVAEKMDGTIYIIYANADVVNYQYKVLKDGEIIAQKNISNGDVTWWFVGYSNDGVDYKIPTDMQSWLPSGGHAYSISYDSYMTPNANVGIYNGYAREWSLDKTILVGHPTWGVVTNSGGTDQTNPYTDPPSIENALYYMGTKVIASYETGGDSEISITPTLSSGTKIADFEIDGVAGALYAPAGGGGGVSDVTVDGTSVVNGSGVAEIDLTGKQDTLTPGSNIQIQNGTISATDTTYSDFAGSAHGLVPPALSGDSEKYLKGDGTWGTPSSGGGGTSDLDAVELTKTQYDALTPAEKTDEDKIYFVEDYTPTPQTDTEKVMLSYNGVGIQRASYVRADNSIPFYAKSEKQVDGGKILENEYRYVEAENQSDAQSLLISKNIVENGITTQMTYSQVGNGKVKAGQLANGTDKSCEIVKDNVVLSGSTWDGTNTELKAALTSILARLSALEQ